MSDEAAPHAVAYDGPERRGPSRPGADDWARMLEEGWEDLQCEKLSPEQARALHMARLDRHARRSAPEASEPTDLKGAPRWFTNILISVLITAVTLLGGYVVHNGDERLRKLEDESSKTVVRLQSLESLTIQAYRLSEEGQKKDLEYIQTLAQIRAQHEEMLRRLDRIEKAVK